MQPEINRKTMFPEATMKQVRAWSRGGASDPRVRRMNLITQLKIGLLYAMFAGCLAGYRITGGGLAVQIAGIAVLGLFAIPFLRVFMHSHMHWKIGNGPVRNFILDHALSMMFSVQQTGYELGHWAHHLYDNDFDPRGFPKDLQSTYVFSRTGKPASMALWGLFYVTVYQFGVQLFHVLNARKKRVVLGFAGDTLVIAAFHAGVYTLSSGFYLGVFLPALGIAWAVAAIALYMMHNLPVDGSRYYHAINCLDPFFNWFGDNDGYHIEHSLFPGIHPAYLKLANGLLAPPRDQQIHDNYVIAGLRVGFARLLGRAERSPGAPAPVTPQERAI